MTNRILIGCISIRAKAQRLGNEIHTPCQATVTEADSNSTRIKENAARVPSMNAMAFQAVTFGISPPPSPPRMWNTIGVHSR